MSKTLAYKLAVQKPCKNLILVAVSMFSEPAISVIAFVSDFTLSAYVPTIATGGINRPINTVAPLRDNSGYI